MTVVHAQEAQIQTNDPPSNLVAQFLARDDGDLVADALVRVEVQRQLGVVALDDDARRLLYRLCTHATLQPGWLLRIASIF